MFGPSLRVHWAYFKVAGWDSVDPREKLEWPCTVGGGGYAPLEPPPPPFQTKVTTGRKTEITIGKIWSGHFWYRNFWVPDAPFTPPPSHASLVDPPPLFFFMVRDSFVTPTHLMDALRKLSHTSKAHHSIQSFTSRLETKRIQWLEVTESAGCRNECRA